MSNKEFLEVCESDINNIFKRNGRIKVSTIFDILGIDNYDHTAEEYYFVNDDDIYDVWTLRHVSELHLYDVNIFT